MRLASLVAIGLVAAGCASETGQDEEDSYVYVTIGRGTSGGLGCAPVTPTFSNPDQTPVGGVRHEGIVWSARVLPGGSVDAMQTCSSSPSSSFRTRTMIVGVEPGDHLSLLGGSGSLPLPADCGRRTVDLITDAGGSHWDDPDAGSMRARIISVSSGSSMPFADNSNTRIVDGETSTTVPYRSDTSGQVPPTSVSVDVISCTSSDYAALRPLL